MHPFFGQRLYNFFGIDSKAPRNLFLIYNANKFPRMVWVYWER